jgi:RNA polymerase sigma factor (sigma-70 family)
MNGLSWAGPLGPIGSPPERLDLQRTLMAAGWDRSRITFCPRPDTTPVMPSTLTQRQARFAKLYEANYAAVAAYGRRRSSEAVAEDLAHETFLVAWRRLDEIPADPLPWLLGVAWRVLANDRRSRQRREALLDRLAQMRDVGGVQSDEPDREAISLPLRTALEALSPASLEALLLVAWEGLTPSSAAKVLGCGETTFRARLFRARRALARALRDSGLDQADRRANTSNSILTRECQ